MRMRLFIFVFLSTILVLPAFPREYDESISMGAGITGITGGEYSFGLGMLPLGTSFEYERYIDMIPSITHDAYFNVGISFSFRNQSFEDYEYDTGIPFWSLKKYEQDESKLMYHGSGSDEYFRPSGAVDVYFEQGFGLNEKALEDPLVIIRLGLNLHFTMATEPLSLSRGDIDEPVFVDGYGNLRDQFKGAILAFPWLQGDRKSFNSIMYTALIFDFDHPIDSNTDEGLYGYITLEWGPKWLFNNLPGRYATSDFYRVQGYFEQKLLLYEVKQDNGWTWVSLMLGHSNSASYIGGDIVPFNRMPTDHLRGYLSDRLWLTFSGPQFLTSDCYTYISLILTNSLYYGTLVNTTSDLSAFEFKSDVSIVFHLRLFGFIRFEYVCRYVFMLGFSAENPRWEQGAALSFYISL